MKNKLGLWNFFQMLGKTFMFPIALLSVSGMMLGLGAGFTDPKMIEMVPFLGNEYVNLVLNFMLTIGLFAFNNLGALFAMAIPLGLLKRKRVWCFFRISRIYSNAYRYKFLFNKS